MRRSIQALLSCCFVAAFLLQSGSAALEDSQTSDEAAHLAAGYSYLVTGDYRMNPEHPPLSKLISAFPLLFSDASLPLDHPSWTQVNEWQFGGRFLYRNVLPPNVLLALGRAPVLIMGVLLLLLMYKWAGALYGGAAALLVLALAAFEPNLLAHSHYVTNDMALGLSYALTLFALWKYRETHQLGWLLAVGVALGMTLGAKFSGALLVPLVPLLLWTRPELEGAPPLERLKRVIAPLSLVALLSYLVLALLYRSEPLTAYWGGYSSMQGSWCGFLLGDISTRGWYHYFLMAWILKTPPALVILTLAALFSVRRLPLRSGEGILLLGAGWFFGWSSLLRINIGIRHILPVLPLLLIVVGRLLLPPLAERLRGLSTRVVLVLVACTALEVGAAHPFYLPYFSSLVGGPFQGHRYLSDSNLDWGQDMKRLAHWADEEGIDAMLLGTFYVGYVKSYGLDYQAVPGFGVLGISERNLRALPRRLLIAQSAINLQGVYFEDPGTQARVRVPIDRNLFHFLLKRKPVVRISPAVWVWDISQDSDAIRRLAMIYLNFGWHGAAVSLFERYLELNPRDDRTRLGMNKLKAELATMPTAPARP